jgi:GTP pyrophosphokinase
LDLFYRVEWEQLKTNNLKILLSLKAIILINFKNKIKKISRTRKRSNQKMKIMICWFWKEQDKLDKLLTCCKSYSGDPCFGFVTINEGIKVHKKDCPQLVCSHYAYRHASTMDRSSQQEFKAILNITE